MPKEVLAPLHFHAYFCYPQVAGTCAFVQSLAQRCRLLSLSQNILPNDSYTDINIASMLFRIELLEGLL